MISAACSSGQAAGKSNETEARLEGSRARGCDRVISAHAREFAVCIIHRRAERAPVMSRAPRAAHVDVSERASALSQ